MAPFSTDPDEWQRLDWTLLRNGPITLYYRIPILHEDIDWLRSHGYRIDELDCSAWESVAMFHDAISAAMDFPGYYGKNLDAFNDALSDIEIPEDSGRAIVLLRYDAFAQRDPEIAHDILDIIARNSRDFLLTGRRFITLVQSDDPWILFEPVGASTVGWNGAESPNKTRHEQSS